MVEMEVGVLQVSNYFLGRREGLHRKKHLYIIRTYVVVVGVLCDARV